MKYGVIDLPADIAGKPIGDVLLQRVPDLYAHPPVLHGEQDQDAVVLAAGADAASHVLEHLRGVGLDVSWLHRIDGRGHDENVASRLFQPFRQIGDLAFAGVVDDVGEVVDRSAERRG